MSLNVDPEVAHTQWQRFTYCVSGEALVLTDKGLVKLRDVTTDHLVNDGVEYVKHGGLIARGKKPCVVHRGVVMTPDHQVLVRGSWVEAKDLPNSPSEETEVFDILNCGPRSSFAVQGDDGLVICHNCRDRAHLDFLTKADRCEKFFQGMQWEEKDLNALRLAKRPALTINKIISTIATVMGEQIYNRSEVLFRPQNGAPAEVAEALTKVWMQIAQNNQLPWVRSDVAADGFIRSRGFYDVRMDFNDAMQGEIRISQQNSKNVVIDPDAEEYDPDKWADVFITKWLTPQDIAVLYDQEAADYLKNDSVSVFPYGYDSIERVRDRFAGDHLNSQYYGIRDPDGVRRNVRVLERQYRLLDNQQHFVDVQTGDTRPVPSDWDRNRVAAFLEKTGGRLSVIKKLTKRIRWTVTAGTVVLHDDWSPYKHFTVVPYFPHFRYGATIGLVENLLGPQELLNKSASQELHIINTTANSGWKVKAGSLVNMSVEELEQSGARTGLVVEVDEVSNLEKITPNATPTGLDRVGYKAEEHIKSISGVSDSMQGFDREDVAAKAIAYKQQRGSVNFTKVLDNLERSDFLLARNVLDLIQQYYTEERILNITHDDPLREPETITINQYDPTTGQIVNDLTLGEYAITITSTPYRATMEDSQFEQARALREIGIPIPDAVLIENSRLNRKADILKQMQGDKESPEAQAQKQLEQRAMEAEVRKKEADVQKTMADVALKQREAQMPPQEDQSAQIEYQRMVQEYELEKEKMEREFELKQQQLQQEMAFKQQQFEQEMAFKAQEQAMKEEQMKQQALRDRLAAERGAFSQRETEMTQ